MLSSLQSHKNSLALLKCCIIIPTYNNERTLWRVINEVSEYCNDILVVNDGSTDTTGEILRQFNNINVLRHLENKGKGCALRLGFKEAIKNGFSYAITIDSDGQHYPDDIPLFISAITTNPGSVIMGSRNMNQEGVPGKSSFGNKFSNFWFLFETGITLPDTQTGFRAYPLDEIKSLRLFTTKFELEIEVLVKLSWRGVPIIPIPIKVKYDPDERISHFRPFRDFTRISILNTYLVILTLLYYLPVRIIKHFRKNGPVTVLKREILKTDDSPVKLSTSIGFGVFMGIVPIWGFQMLVAVLLAYLLRLNKIIVLAASNISITPMIPPIVFASYLIGGFFVNDKISFKSLADVSLDSIYLNLTQYLIGSIILALISGGIATIISYLFLYKNRN